MQGKICLVTGATAGIGWETARGLAARGATVIVVGRDAARTAVAVQRIQTATGNQRVDSLLADLSSQVDVRRLAEQVISRYPRLDVLVNNAGALFMQRGETVDGIERTFGLNYLNVFLLTNLLLPSLRASAPARIVTVSSSSHRGAQIDFADLEARRSYGYMRAYGQSKLAEVLFTYELARRLAGTGVTANALHPGFVGSNFARNNGIVVSVVMTLARLIAIGPEEGARTSIYLASSPEVDGVTGKFFEKCREVPSSPSSYDVDASRRLWDISARMTGLTA